MGGGVGWGSVPPPEICNRAECAGNEGSMTIEERLAEAQKLIDEVKAELAAKAKPARNWPEKIEPGMVFAYKDGAAYIYTDFACDYLICINGVGNDKYGTGFTKDVFHKRSHLFTYLGHARDRITIRTEKAEAHEPTGEELVAPQELRAKDAEIEDLKYELQDLQERFNAIA